MGRSDKSSLVGNRKCSMSRNSSLRSSCEWGEAAASLRWKAMIWIVFSWYERYFTLFLLKSLFPSEICTNKNNCQFSKGLWGSPWGEGVSLSFHSFQVFLIWRENLSPWGENEGRSCSQSFQTYCLCWEQHSEREVKGNTCGKERDRDSSEMHGCKPHQKNCGWEVSQHLSSTCETLGSIPQKRPPCPHFFSRRT